ncbi:hypothetical protein [Sulfitobacter sp. R18_1]|uniref:hypothetical protein n=1 Tax=Sulfitobacter sp. R18_1 TaxID=2821104 RepID=UPI001ADC0785|nr:hypothetical protein [Sulfitobacter sp. R18_1]MBO9428840.1 hypothetical protein [Sulfitobacter sp. R18_1]
MDSIIREKNNEAFLKEGEERGYRPYIDSLKAQKNQRTPGFYQGSIQKRVADDDGTRYFLNIDMFDMGAVSIRASNHWSARAWVQFHVESEHGKVADVEISFENFADTEAFFDDIWTKMEFGHYEKD